MRKTCIFLQFMPYYSLHLQFQQLLERVLPKRCCSRYLRQFSLVSAPESAYSSVNINHPAPALPIIEQEPQMDLGSQNSNVSSQEALSEKMPAVPNPIRTSNAI
jgi:hypothetical protein